MIGVRFAGNKTPLCVVQIEVWPFRLPQLTRTHSKKRSKTQRTTDRKSPLVSIHRAQQLTKLLRVRDRGKVDRLYFRRECPAQTGSRIPLASSRQQ